MLHVLLIQRHQANKVEGPKERSSNLTAAMACPLPEAECQPSAVAQARGDEATARPRKLARGGIRLEGIR